jgi:uncharacterized protein DUF5675
VTSWLPPHFIMLEVKRVAVIPEGAFGVALWNTVPFAVTLERTYDDNQVKIDSGIYNCRRTVYHRGNYATFEILVPGHSRILFHKGNVESELEGCVAVGEEFGILDGKPAILQSGRGFSELMKLTSDIHDLTVEFK